MYDARMPTTTETALVWGTTSTKLLRAIDELLPGFVLHSTHAMGNPFVDPEPELPARARQVPIARKGSWFSVGTEQLGTLDVCGKKLSKTLGRSVLTVGTSDDEASLWAKRWKHGRVLAELTLLAEAYRGPGDRPHAPAKVLWPWLPKNARTKILREGIQLSAKRGKKGEPPYADEQDSMAALTKAIGAPDRSPWMARPSLMLVYAPE